jgi:hypothetical protein
MLCYAYIAESRDRWRPTSMTSVGKVTATVWRVCVCENVYFLEKMSLHYRNVIWSIRAFQIRLVD